MAIADTDAEEQAVRALLERLDHAIDHAIETVLEGQSPRFARWAEIRALIYRAGQRMVEATEIEGEQAQPHIAAMRDHLDMVLPPGSRTTH